MVALAPLPSSLGEATLQSVEAALQDFVHGSSCVGIEMQGISVLCSEDGVYCDK